MSTCRWTTGETCERAAKYEVKTIEGWKAVCRKHADRYGHWVEIRKVRVPA